MFSRGGPDYAEWGFIWISHSSRPKGRDGRLGVPRTSTDLDTKNHPTPRHPRPSGPPPTTTSSAWSAQARILPNIHSSRHRWTEIEQSKDLPRPPCQCPTGNPNKTNTHTPKPYVLTDTMTDVAHTNHLGEPSPHPHPAHLGDPNSNSLRSRGLSLQPSVRFSPTVPVPPPALVGSAGRNASRATRSPGVRSREFSGTGARCPRTHDAHGDRCDQTGRPGTCRAPKRRHSKSLRLGAAGGLYGPLHQMGRFFRAMTEEKRTVPDYPDPHVSFQTQQPPATLCFSCPITYST